MADHTNETGVPAALEVGVEGHAISVEYSLAVMAEIRAKVVMNVAELAAAASKPAACFSACGTANRFESRPGDRFRVRTSVGHRSCWRRKTNLGCGTFSAGIRWNRPLPG
jgi:hypothetical protein